MLPTTSFGQELEVAKESNIFISSTPPGAQVYVDGIPRGETPLTYRDSLGGRHSLYLTLSQFVPVADSIDVVLGVHSQKHITLTLGSSLSVVSDPEGSSVYLLNDYKGRTPIVIQEIAPGPTVVKIIRSMYQSSIDTLILLPGSLTNASYKLRPIPARLRIHAPESDVELTLNDQVISTGSVIDTLISPGRLELLARQPSTGKRADLSLFALPKSDFDLEVKFNYRSLEPFYASLLFPGWGQFKAGQPYLGSAFGIAFGGSVAVAVLNQYKFMKNNSDHQDAIDGLANASISSEAKSYHEKVATTYDNIHLAYRARNIAIATTVLIYILSAADAYFIHDTQDLFRETTESYPNSLVPGVSHAAMTTVRWRIPL
jgi:hypothetical protein